MKRIGNRWFASAGWSAACLAATLLVGCQPKESADTKNASGAPGAAARDEALERPPVVVTVAEVAEQPVRRTISVVGTLHGFEKTTLAPKVEGRVAAWHFDVGDRVQPGQTLLDIDPTDFQLAVEEAQRGLEQELARLGIEELPKQAFNVDSLPSVSRAELLMENSRKRFERQRVLVQDRAAAREAFESAETELRVSEAALKQARMDAKWSVAAVRQRQAVLAVAQQRLADCKLLAPALPPAEELAGRDYVVSKRMVAVGEVVRAVPATPVYELVVDAPLKLKAMVPERTIRQVTLGQDVEVRVEAYPQEVFPAKVRRLNPTIDPKNRTFEIEAYVPNDDRRLRPGGFAKAELVLADTSDALTVPPEAIVSLAGVNKVFVLEGERVREAQVDLAMRDPQWVEVQGELKPGQKVVTSGHSQLFDGARATLRDSQP